MRIRQCSAYFRLIEYIVACPWNTYVFLFERIRNRQNHIAVIGCRGKKQFMTHGKINALEGPNIFCHICALIKKISSSRI